MNQPTLFPEGLPIAERPDSPLPLEAAVKALDTLTTDEIQRVQTAVGAEITKLESLLRGYDRLFDDVNGGTRDEIQEYLNKVGGIEVIEHARSDLAKSKVYRELIQTSLRTSAIIE